MHCLPNMLSISRVPLSLVVYYSITARQNHLTALCIGYALLSDFLDGMLARAYGVDSGVGILLDALSDKLFLIGLYLGLTTIHPQHQVGLMLVVLKEVVMLAGCVMLYLSGFSATTFKSVTIGKIALVVNMISGLMITLNVSALPAVLASVTASCAAALYYVLRICKFV